MIYVICANDSLEEATKDEFLAKKRMKVLQKKHYKQSVNMYGVKLSFEDYTRRVYWHIHEVKEVA